MKNLDKIPDPAPDFREHLEQLELFAEFAEKTPKSKARLLVGKAYRLGARQKILLCAEILGTNKSKRAIARLHGVSAATVGYYSQKVCRNCLSAAGTQRRKRLSLSSKIALLDSPQQADSLGVSRRTLRAFLKKIKSEPPPILYRRDGITPFFYE